MENEKKIKEFLKINIDTFLSDILELPSKERAKAFLELSKAIEVEPENKTCIGIAPIHWLSNDNMTIEEIRKEILELEEKLEAKKEEIGSAIFYGNGQSEDNYKFSKGKLNDMQ
jgi:hypothetical protein